MKKLFLTICFSLVLANLPAAARIVEIKDVTSIPKEPVPIDMTAPEGLPDPNNTEEVIAFFRDRFNNASVSRAENLNDLNQSNAVDVQHSTEYIRQMQENSKSTFEKIYDQAIGRITDTPKDDVLASGTRFFELASELLFYSGRDYF